MKSQLGRICQTHKNPALHSPGISCLNLNYGKCSQWVAALRSSTAVACRNCDWVHLELQRGFHGKCVWGEMKSGVHCIPGAGSLRHDHVVGDAVSR